MPGPWRCCTPPPSLPRHRPSCCGRRPGRCPESKRPSAGHPVAAPGARLTDVQCSVSWLLACWEISPKTRRCSCFAAPVLLVPVSARFCCLPVGGQLRGRELLAVARRGGGPRRERELLRHDPQLGDQFLDVAQVLAAVTGIQVLTVGRNGWHAVALCNRAGCHGR